MHAQEAIRLIKRQADRLRTLDAFDARQPSFRRWFRETKAAFDSIFGPAKGPNREFQEVIFQPLTPSKSDPDSDWRQAYDRGVPVALTFFDSVVEDLTAHPEHVDGSSAAEREANAEDASGAAAPSDKAADRTAGKAAGKGSTRGKTCLVVGDGESPDEVVGFLEKIGSRAIALPVPAESEGSISLLDRLDDHGDVGFAVMFLTADEAGTRARTKTAKPARRRNPSLELGILLGRLGRKNLCVLYREGVGIPPESDGILCVPLDARGAWRFDLARAMKAAGLPIDLNNAVV